MLFETTRDAERYNKKISGRKAMARTNENDLELRIKELRSELGLTQEQFASKVGVTFSTVNRWESGKSKPSPLACQRLHGLLKQLKK